MKIKVRYFGQIKEITGKSDEYLVEQFETVQSLKSFLKKRYPELNALNFKIAQDNKIDEYSSHLHGTLIDLLPHFSGG